MSAKNRFYVVWRGRRTGIFDSWEACKQSVIGFDGAQYKGYPTLDAAQRAHGMNYWQAIRGSADNVSGVVLSDKSGKTEIVVPSLCVDAACSGNPGLMEYRGVWTESGKEIFRIGPLEQGTNNIGEFLALVHGLALLKKNGSPIPIYSDSVNAISWVRAKKCRTKLARTEKNIPVFNLIARAERWLQENSYATQIMKWETGSWGEIPADFGRK